MVVCNFLAESIYFYLRIELGFFGPVLEFLFQEQEIGPKLKLLDLHATKCCVCEPFNYMISSMQLHLRSDMERIYDC